MNGHRLFNTVVVASTSAASFLFGVHLSSDSVDWGRANGILCRFMPIRQAKAATAPVERLPALQPQPIFEEKPKVAVPLKVHLEDLEIWKSPSRAEQIMKFGYPGFDNLRTYEDFVLSYDRRTRTAYWVVEHLSPDRMTYNPSVDRSKCMFRPDESIHEYFQSKNSDYFRSGYDRGHLAAAGNHRRTQQAINQTFFLTNMSPQVGKGFNRDKWNDLEKHCRQLARVHPNVYICTGPLYLPYRESDGNLYIKYKVIGDNRVAVPTHFFKVLLFERIDGKYELESYLMPNAAIPDETPIANFLVPLDTIERPAGFLIFELMPRDRVVKINGKDTAAKRSSFIGSLFGGGGDGKPTVPAITTAAAPAA